MKLRLRHNSVRLRLTQAEVVQLRDQGSVEEHIDFTPGQVLTYRVIAVPDRPSIWAEYESNMVLVSIPAAIVSEWANSSQVAIEASGSLRISIEKDFRCLDRTHIEEDTDTFPNPLEGKVC